MSADDLQKNERDFPSEMIDWLSDKDPDVRFYVSEFLNWDFSEDVLNWIVAQKDSDKANIAMIFCLMNPDEFVTDYHEGDTADEIEYHTLFLTIVKNWKSDHYNRAELTLDHGQYVGDLKNAYATAVSERPDKKDPFDIPADLFGPFAGRVPQVPTELLAENNVLLKELINGLGSSC